MGGGGGVLPVGGVVVFGFQTKTEPHKQKVGCKSTLLVPTPGNFINGLDGNFNPKYYFSMGHQRLSLSSIISSCLLSGYLMFTAGRVKFLVSLVISFFR